MKKRISNDDNDERKIEELLVKKRKVEEFPDDICMEIMKYITRRNDQFSILCVSKRWNELGRIYLPFQEDTIHHVIMKCTDSQKEKLYEKSLQWLFKRVDPSVYNNVAMQAASYFANT